MRFTVQIVILLEFTFWIQKEQCYRSYSPFTLHLDLDLEPPLTYDEYDESEPLEFRFFPIFRSKPPVLLPDGSLLSTTGSVQLPNRSVLMTTFYNDSFVPDTWHSFGTVRLVNGTTVAADSTPYPLPPGLVLNATTTNATDTFPPLILPRRTFVFRNGTIFVNGRYNLPTVFVEGFIPYCDGITCHLKTP